MMGMQAQIKRLNIAVRDHVQLMGYRGFVESIARDCGIKKGIVYNDRDGSVKIVCEGVETAVNDFIESIKVSNEGISIEVREFKDEVYLPEFGRVVVNVERETFERLDEGVERLGSIDSRLMAVQEDTTRLKGIQEDTAKLGSIDKKLGTMNKRLDTLPTRIAEALGNLSRKYPP